MKKYTDRERLDALNRHRNTLHIDKENGFTTLTQHVNYDTIEEFCDTILHSENFNKAYGYNGFFHEKLTILYKKRREVFFTENRLLTEKETENAIKEEEELQEIFKKYQNKV